MADEDTPSAQTSLFDGASGPGSGDGEPADPAGHELTPEDEDGGAIVSPDERPGRRSTFVLGRTDRRTTELRVIEDTDSPISGPFRVKAVVRDSDARAPREPSDG